MRDFKKFLFKYIGFNSYYSSVLAIDLVRVDFTSVRLKSEIGWLLA